MMHSKLTENPLTVLSLISSEGYFGVENMLVNLGVALNNLGCRCVIGVLRDSRYKHAEVAERAMARGLEVEVISCAGRFDPAAIVKIRKLLKAYRATVVHSHGYKADLYGWAAAWNRETALVATSHNWPGKSRIMRLYAALDRINLRAFDRIVVVSDEVAQILKQSGISSSKVVTIANGVDVDSYRSASASLRDELGCSGPLVGFVGRLVPDKGGEILLRAAVKVLRVHPKTKFVFVGDGPCLAEWESLASSLGISANAVFTGVRADMPGVYASLDVMVLPSFCEAMPMCVLEAMAAGKCVIATRVGAISKVVTPNQTGLLVEPRDVDGLSDAIDAVLSNPARSRQLGENGRARVVQDFSSEAMATKYLQLYEQCAGVREQSFRKVLAPIA